MLSSRKESLTSNHFVSYSFGSVTDVRLSFAHLSVISFKGLSLSVNYQHEMVKHSQF